MFESKNLLAISPKGESQWQADHVNALGIWTAIARRDTRKGVKDDAWSTIQDAVLGEQSQVRPLTCHHIVCFG